jgi:Zn-dependent protease with chaperone function
LSTTKIDRTTSAATNANAPPLYKLFREAVEVLDIDPVPPLFLAHSPALNAWTFGSERPYVVVTSALVEGFTDAEIQCVMGHELGHILAGHSLYRTVGSILLSLTRLGMSLAGAVVALPAWLLSRGLLSAFFYWMRCAELTSDRAGLLVVQDPAIAYTTEARLAGGPGHKIAQMLNVERYLEQAREFEEDPDSNHRLMSFLLQDMRSHPFPAVRARELETWVQSGDYEKIISGDYSKRPSIIVAGTSQEPANRPEQCRLTQDVVLLKLARVYGVSCAPRIPQDQLQAAVEHFAPCDEDELILAHYDGGMDANDALLLTTRRLYAARNPGKGIPYDRLESLTATTLGLLRTPAIAVNFDELRLCFHRSELRDGILDALVAARELARKSA